MDEEIVPILVLIGVIIGILFSGWIMFDWGGVSAIEELGKSICEEEYGMDFESYHNEVLKCKPFKEVYDGIKVEVPKTLGGENSNAE